MYGVIANSVSCSKHGVVQSLTDFGLYKYRYLVYSFGAPTVVEMKIVLILMSAFLVPYGARADAGLTIFATAPNTLSYRSYDNKILLDSTYGEDIIIFCTADNAKLTTNGSNLQVEQYNSTTIQVLIKKPDVGEHTYLCHTNGNSQSLIVTVYPLVEVIASSIHHTQYKHKTLYFVPNGEKYDVFCSANDDKALALTIYSNDFEELSTNVTNTTVSALNNTKGKSYICQKGISKFFDVIVDYKPEARNFKCILYLNHKLECMWKSSSTRNTFILSSGGNLICTDMSGSVLGRCERAWNEELEDIYVYNNKIHFQLKACNRVYCNDQLFSINIKSIIKVEPVYNLQLTYDRTLKMAAVEWRHRNYLCYRGCDFKVGYRLVGTHWRETDVSALVCHDFSAGVWCKLRLTLPCPEAQHEVRVNVKPLSTEDNWSEPASVVYTTPPGADDDIDDTSCEEFQRQEPSSVDVLHEIHELISEMNKNQIHKLAEIKALLDSQM